MKKYIYLLIFALVGLVGCDTGTNTPDPQIIHDTIKVDTSKHDTTPSVVAKTCLEYKNGIPAGTYAKRIRTGESVKLDSKGCFSFEPRAEVAARSLAIGDSIIFYNDSALFSITIPYVSNGDTINVVPTVVSLKNCPNNAVDSVYLAVFDKVHILSRKVKMKKANFGDSSEYGRTLWSVDNGNTFQVHYEIHAKTSTWATSVISSEPGGTISLNYSQVKKSSVPNAIGFSDSVFFYSDSLVIFGDDSIPSRFTVSKTSIKLGAYSIYGIASIKVDGVLTDSIKFVEYDSLFNVESVNYDSLLALYSGNTFKIIENPRPLKTLNVVVTDSAGYILTKTIKVWGCKNLIYRNSEVLDHPGMVEYNLNTNAISLYR